MTDPNETFALVGLFSVAARTISVDDVQELVKLLQSQKARATLDPSPNAPLNAKRIDGNIAVMMSFLSFLETLRRQREAESLIGGVIHA